MYIGMGTVQVSAVIEVHGDSDINYAVHGDRVELTLGSDTDACLVLSERGTERLAETINQAAGELRSQRERD
jgi:hypothetical protein